MGHSDTLISHDGRTDFLQELLYHGYLEDTHAEIARQFITQGEDGLSSEQRLILEKYVFSEFYGKTCLRCQCGPEWEDMYEVVIGEGYCGRCLHRMSKDD